MVRLLDNRPGRKTSDPVFIVGAARSGTTLLRLILDSHSALSICGELHFYDQIRRLRPALPVLETETDLDRAARFVRRTTAHGLLESGSEIVEGAMDALRMELPCPFDRLHGAMLRARAEVRGAGEGVRCGEKTPANVRYLEEITRQFPRADFIHVVRDPRAVAASSIQVEGNSRDVMIHSLTWRCDVYSARKFIRSDRGRVLEVRYEDLVRNPRAEVMRVSDFLNLQFEEGMLRFHSEADDKVRVEKEPWKKGATKPIYRSSVDRWKGELTIEQVWLIERAAGRFLPTYGYSRSERRATWRECVRGGLEAARKYVSAKLAARRLVDAGAENLIDSDTSILRTLLLESLLEPHPSRLRDAAAKASAS